MIIKQANLIGGYSIKIDNIEIQINHVTKEIFLLKFQNGRYTYEKSKDYKWLKDTIRYLFLYKLLDAYK